MGQCRVVLAYGLASVPSSAHSLSACGLTFKVLSFRTCLMISSILKFISSSLTFNYTSFQAIFSILEISSDYSITCTNDLHSQSNYSNFQLDWSQTSCLSLMLYSSKLRIFAYRSNISARCRLASFLCLSIQTSYFFIVFYLSWMPLRSYSRSAVPDKLSFYSYLQIISGISSDRKSTLESDRECFKPNRQRLWKRRGQVGSLHIRLASQMRLMTSYIPCGCGQGRSLCYIVLGSRAELYSLLCCPGYIRVADSCFSWQSCKICSSFPMSSCCCWTNCSEIE